MTSMSSLLQLEWRSSRNRAVIPSRYYRYLTLSGNALANAQIAESWRLFWNWEGKRQILKIGNASYETYIPFNHLRKQTILRNKNKDSRLQTGSTPINHWTWPIPREQIYDSDRSEAQILAQARTLSIRYSSLFISMLTDRNNDSRTDTLSDGDKWNFWYFHNNVWDVLQCNTQGKSEMHKLFGTLSFCFVLIF
jgi:hypothetical protein